MCNWTSYRQRNTSGLWDGKGREFNIQFHTMRWHVHDILLEVSSTRDILHDGRLRCRCQYSAFHSRQLCKRHNNCGVLSKQPIAKRTHVLAMFPRLYRLRRNGRFTANLHNIKIRKHVGSFRSLPAVGHKQLVVVHMPLRFPVVPCPLEYGEVRRAALCLPLQTYSYASSHKGRRFLCVVSGVDRGVCARYFSCSPGCASVLCDTFVVYGCANSLADRLDGEADPLSPKKYKTQSISDYERISSQS